MWMHGPKTVLVTGRSACRVNDGKTALNDVDSFL